jgi:hypothetical protein
MPQALYMSDPVMEISLQMSIILKETIGELDLECNSRHLTL